MFCLRYLTSAPVNDGQIHPETRDEVVKTGYHGLIEYTMAFWDHHISKYHSAKCQEEASIIPGDMLAVWQQFVSKYDDGRRIRPHDSTIPSDDMHATFSGWVETKSSLGFQRLVQSLRRTSNSVVISLTEREKKSYLHLVGPSQHRCSQRDCGRFDRGFASEPDLRTHIEEHVMAFKCPHDGCYAVNSGFPSTTSLQAHIDRTHQEDTTQQGAALFPRLSEVPKSMLEACTKGDLDAIRAFVASGVSVHENFDNNSRLTPIVLAASKRHFHVCEYLISQGANPYGMSYNRSAIEEALKRHDHELFLLICNKSPGGWDSESGSPFVESKKFEELMVKALYFPHQDAFRAFVSWNKLRKKPITLGSIVCSGHQRVVSVPSQAFVRSNLYALMNQNLSDTDGTVSQGHQTFQTTFYKDVLENGLDFMCIVRNELLRIWEFIGEILSQKEFETLLMKNDNIRRRPLLFQVIEGSHDSILSFIFQHVSTAAKEVRGPNGYTALHSAASGYVEMSTFSVVLEHCADLIQVETADGQTVLHRLAVSNLDSKAVKKAMLLCDRKEGSLDIWKRDHRGATAFGLAISKYVHHDNMRNLSYRFLEYLFSLDNALAAAEDDDEEALTPLDHAWVARHPNTLRFLLNLSESNTLLSSSRVSWSLPSKTYHLISSLLDQLEAAAMLELDHTNSEATIYFDATKKVLRYCDLDETEQTTGPAVHASKLQEGTCGEIAMLLFLTGITKLKWVKSDFESGWHAQGGWRSISELLKYHSFEIQADRRGWKFILTRLCGLGLILGHPHLTEAGKTLLS